MFARAAYTSVNAVSAPSSDGIVPKTALSARYLWQSRVEHGGGGEITCQPCSTQTARAHRALTRRRRRTRAGSSCVFARSECSKGACVLRLPSLRSTREMLPRRGGER